MIGYGRRIELCPHFGAAAKGGRRFASDQADDLQLGIEQGIDDITQPGNLGHLIEVFAEILVDVAVVEHDRLLAASTGD